MKKLSRKGQNEQKYLHILIKLIFFFHDQISETNHKLVGHFHLATQIFLRKQTHTYL